MFAKTIRSHRQVSLQKLGNSRGHYLSGDQESYIVSLSQILPDYGFEITADVAINILEDFMESFDLTYIPKCKWL